MKRPQKRTLAVYPGSFDPITYGHLDIIARAIPLFDEVRVAVIENPGKQPTFSLTERLAMVKKSVATFGRHVRVDGFQGLLVNYVKRLKASVILRGLRAVSDFDYEFQMALTNYHMSPKISTVFLMTDEKYSFLSSSLVRQIALLGGGVKDFVPSPVERMLYKKYSNGKLRKGG